MKENLHKNVVNTISKEDPLTILGDREFEETIFKLGSFLSIVHNKRINQTLLLTSILEDEDFRKIIIKLTEIEEPMLLISKILNKYPQLAKSKIVTNKIEALKRKHVNRRRKKIL